MKSVTIGCKVSADEKRMVEQTAINLGLDKSGFIRARVFQDLEKLEQLASLDDDLVIAPEYTESISALLLSLKKRHPDRHPSAILQGALSLALENEGRFVSNKLKRHLS